MSSDDLSSAASRAVENHPGPVDFPILAPVVALAVDAVAFSFDIDEESEPELIAELTRVATARTREVYVGLAAIATQNAGAARRSRELRAQQAAQAAKALATRVADMAASLEVSNEARALAVALEAVGAAEAMAEREFDETAPRATQAAAEVATAVRAAAATALRDRADAAALVAQSALSIAAETARSIHMEDIALELETSTTAVAVLAITFETCYQTAIEAAATAAEHALGDRGSRQRSSLGRLIPQD